MATSVTSGEEVWLDPLLAGPAAGRGAPEESVPSPCPWRGEPAGKERAEPVLVALLAREAQTLVSLVWTSRVRKGEWRDVRPMGGSLVGSAASRGAPVKCVPESRPVKRRNRREAVVIRGRWSHCDKQNQPAVIVNKQEFNLTSVG